MPSYNWFKIDILRLLPPKTRLGSQGQILNGHFNNNKNLKNSYGTGDPCQKNHRKNPFFNPILSALNHNFVRVICLERRHCNASNVELQLGFELWKSGLTILQLRLVEGGYNAPESTHPQLFVTKILSLILSDTIFSFIHMAVDYDDTAIGVI